MKHVFIVETAEGDPIEGRDIPSIINKIEKVIEDHIKGICWVTSNCNQPSATRGVYRLYNLDESQSPDQIGSAK